MHNCQPATKTQSKFAKLLRVITGGLLIGGAVIPAISAIPVSANPCTVSSISEACSRNIDLAQAETLPSSATPTADQIPGETSEPFNLTELLPGNSGIRVVPNAEPVDVTLVNETDATVAFRLIKETYTNARTTMGMIESTGVTLHGLETPLSMTFVSRDGSFLEVTPRVISPNQLEVVLSDPVSTSNVAGDRLEIPGEDVETQL